jgi:hypothetical protein
MVGQGCRQRIKEPVTGTLVTHKVEETGRQPSGCLKLKAGSMEGLCVQPPWPLGSNGSPLLPLLTTPGAPLLESPKQSLSWHGVREEFEALGLEWGRL